jgi:flagellar hook assembly protein FlgD
MQNLNKTMSSQQAFASLTQASGMIGKYVQLQDSTDGSTVITGQVSEVRNIDGDVKVVIDGKEYKSTDITKVSDKVIKQTPTATGTA